MAEQVLVSPHAVAVQVKVREWLQGGVKSSTKSQLTPTGPHSLEAVTTKSAHSGRSAGLHPRSYPVGHPSSTGSVAVDQVKMAEQVLVKPQAVAVQVSFLEKLHGPVRISVSAQVTPTGPHSFSAVTV